ncbi:alpha/beta fold hydrolase [Sinosporangium siamense]|uniref:Uncharacterized protein n=1 Tax=Sinosporangium siamense TaxID=1367973 RepID=A0A919RRG2_9ACTN|nr:alpha/beta fold hydrolase [Sinosporangium siamense]GII97379.1 hypothetical protein Ssi02_76100 [Sinosporangium siamense]
MCGTGPLAATPDNKRAYDEVLKTNTADTERCRNAAPELFANLDSATQARDMDAIRAALGEEKLTYLGNSYGGVLGASYARLFPKRVRAMALDSVPNHVVPVAKSTRLLYQGVERTFARFADWCAKSADCVLRGKDVAKTWRAVLRQADRNPLPGAPAAGDRRYDSKDLKVLSQLLMLREATWPAWAAAIKRASEGNASGFDPQGRGLMRQPSAMLATRCADGYSVDGYAGYRASLARSAKVSPHFAGIWESGVLSCSPWAKTTNPLAPLPGHKLPPLLGIGPVYEHDSVRGITDQVPGSVTLRYDGNLHGPYVNAGDKCVIAHVNRYLIDGKLPAAGARCPVAVT